MSKQTVLPDQALPWPIVWAAVVLLCSSEALRLKAYPDPATRAAPWTCGWGETAGVKPTDVWTKEYADSRLCSELTALTAQVQALCTRHPTDEQLGALVCFAYNVGIGAFAKSSVLRAHNAGDTAAAARSFALYNKAKVGGKLTEMAGLTARRAHEASLYLTQHEEAPAHPLPQVVAPESSLVKSPIAQAGGLTAGVSVLQLLTDNASPAKEKLDSVNSLASAVHATVSSLADFVGVAPSTLTWGLVAAAGAYALYWRFKQRAQGFA